MPYSIVVLAVFWFLLFWLSLQTKGILEVGLWKLLYWLRWWRSDGLFVGDIEDLAMIFDPLLEI